MSSNRFTHSLAVVLIFSLFVLTLQVSSIEAATEDSWASKAPLLTKKQGLGAAVVNGKIYALGGYPINNKSARAL